MAVLVVVALVALVRLRVADVPLERDEGEYAYAGQLILQGIPPYRLAYNMKFPGTYYAYGAILALFGQTVPGVHAGLLVVNAATTLALFFLGRRLIGGWPAAAAAAAFALLSLDRWIMGVFAHATHFVLLPAVAGLLVLLRALETERPRAFLAAGALVGTALLMKQHAVLFLPLAMGLATWHEWRRPGPSLRTTALRNGWLLAGAAIPFVAVCAVLTAQGVLGTFWFWTFRYAREYVSQVPLAEAWPSFLEGWRVVTRATLPIWLLAAAGAVALWLVPRRPDTRVFLTGLLVASFLAVCPGFHFRPHYFIVLLPAAGLLVGVAVASTAEVLGRVMPVTLARTVALAVLLAALGSYVAVEQRYLSSMTARELSRAVYGPNPFVEAVEIGRYLRERTAPEARIAVVGSEPEIYFYAGRKSATGYLYTYPLMEPQRYAGLMQDEMIREIEAAHPEHLVVVGMSLGVRPTSDRKLLDWIQRYASRCYDLAGIADIRSMEATTIRWNGDARGYTPRSPHVVYTLRRKSALPCTASG